MNKLAKKFSFIGSRRDTGPSMFSKLANIQRNFFEYFDKTPEGTAIVWANGTITRTKYGATYIDSKGNEIKLNKQTNPIWLLKNPDIKEQYEKQYFHTFPELYSEPLILGKTIINNNTSITPVYDTAFVDASCCTNRDFLQQYYETFNLLAIEIALQFPDRPCSKLTFLDASSRTGICVNHETHNCFPPTCIDIQYYTKGETNYTQRGTPKTVLWDENNNLKLDVFDAERMAMLIVLMAEAFPSLVESSAGNTCQVIVGPQFKGEMLKLYPKNSEEYNHINKILMEDTSKKYNHEFHMHVYLRGDVNLDMEV